MSNRFFLKKPIAAIQRDCNAHGLARTLTATNLVSLGIGCIIGAGIFVMTGKAAADHAGPAIILSFILAGAACAFAALCYAELASVLPVSGSAYTYTYATLGEAFAWVMGWLLVLEYGLASATVAVGWSGYVNSLLIGLGVFLPPELTTAFGQTIQIVSELQPIYLSHGFTFDAANTLLMNGLPVTGKFNLPAFLGIAAVTLLLVVGISESAKVNNIIVAIKLTVVVAFIGVGLFYIDPANWHPFIPEYIPPAPGEIEGKYGFDGILRASSIIFFAYIGFEAVSTAAQEAKNPQRDMPIGILGSLAICTVLYMLVCAVLTGIVPYTELSVPDPMAVAVDKIGLKWFAFLVKIGAIAGLSSVMLVLLYGQTRIFYIMSHDGLLPAFFSKVHARFRTPHLNTLLVGSIVAVAAALTPLKVLGDLVSVGTLCAFIMVCFSVLYLRKKEPGLPRPFRTPFTPWVPLLGMGTCAYLISGVPFHTFKSLLVWLLIGAVVYVCYGRRHSKVALGEV